MARYCTCPICTQSPAQPNNIVPGPVEQIRGARVGMLPGWTLAHWSRADFASMTSIEIHDFWQLGHKLRVGVSFYLYQEAAPAVGPRQLFAMGLGGGRRYTIDHTLGNEMEVFYKGNVAANPAEVTINLGCGGSITFNAARQATDFDQRLTLPILRIIR